MTVRNCFVEVANGGFSEKSGSTEAYYREELLGGLIASVGKFGYSNNAYNDAKNESPAFSGSFENVYAIGDADGKWGAFVDVASNISEKDSSCFRRTRICRR
jgi:hypothetical protein